MPATSTDRMWHDLRGLGIIALDSVAKIDPRRQDQAVIRQTAAALQTDLARLGIDRLDHVMHHLDAVPAAQVVIAMSDKVHGAFPAEDPVAAGAGDKRLLGFDQRDLDVRGELAQVARRSRSAETAANDDDAGAAGARCRRDGHATRTGASRRDRKAGSLEKPPSAETRHDHCPPWLEMYSATATISSSV